MSGAADIRGAARGACLALARRGWIALAAAALCCACAVLACAAFPPAAWADESSEPSNQVYVGQLSDSSFLYETAIADLAQASSFYEGQTVMVSGEVVGDCINDETASGKCWITLQDDAEDPSTVAVVMDKSATESIDAYGRYGQKGTTLQVRGTFHLACRDHQGMSDIHAEAVTALAEGEAVSSAVDERVLCVAVVAVAAGIALLAVYHVRRERTL